MDSPSEKTLKPRMFSKYLGRHRQLPLSRTVFAAIAAATLIGSGLSAAVAADGPGDAPAAVAAADREEQAQANRDSQREAPAEDEAPEEPEAAEEEVEATETPETKEAEPAPAPDWVVPSPAPISDVYGPRDWRGGEMHYGTDFAAAEGAENYAAADGTVVQSGSNGGYGLGITIEHDNGIVTVYGHHSKLLVEVGDKVKAGDAIGLAGSTGDVTGPHLHFEVYVDGAPTDPVKFLKDKDVDL